MHIKISDLDGRLSPEEVEDVLNDGFFLYDMQQTFRHYMLIPDMPTYSDPFLKMDLFVDSNWNSNASTIGYYILKLLLGSDDYYTENVLGVMLQNIHQKMLRMVLGQKQFFFEFAMYNEPLDDTDKSIMYVSQSNSDTPAKMELIRSRKFSRDEDIDYCNNFPISLMHKMHVCPFIEIRTDEFLMDLEKDYLVLKSRDLMTKFSPFEYQLQNDTVQLCLSDYLPFYYSLSTTEVVSGTAARYNIGKISQIIFWTVYFKVLHQMLA